ncbi:MAG: transcription termination factor NusA [Planctomycetota bacterium]|jgi:N utilization substance protein A
MNQELLRIVDAMARDKNIDKEVVFEDLEAAILSAIRKAYQRSEDVGVTIDRTTGEITAVVDGEALAMRELSRIAAQTAKQVMIQKIREAERDSIYEEYLERRGQIVTGRVSRREGGTLIVELGRAEAILPKSEQIPGETHDREDRVRAMVLEVRDQGSQIRIVLSRTHPDFVRRLFELEVPEVAEKIIEMRALAREAGYRTKVAVNSLDSKVDAVGACVGVRGSRIKSIVDELGGEKIDIVRWNDSSKILIANALKPAEVYDISLCFELGRAIVVVTEDQLSLAIGKRGQNVRLAARLTQWDIDILTPNEFNAGLEVLEKTLEAVEGVDRQIVSQVIALGMVNVLDVEEVGAGPLVKELQLDQVLADRMVQACGEQARRIAEAGAEQEAAAGAEPPAEEPAAEAAPAEAAAGAEPPAEEPAAEAEPPVEEPAAEAAPAEAEAGAEEAAPTPAPTPAAAPVPTAPSEPGEPVEPTEMVEAVEAAEAAETAEAAQSAGPAVAEAVAPVAAPPTPAVPAGQDAGESPASDEKTDQPEGGQADETVGPQSASGPKP